MTGLLQVGMLPPELNNDFVFIVLWKIPHATALLIGNANFSYWAAFILILIK